jgi:excisionase family DNA binding protein
MADEKLLTVREVALMLRITEKEVTDLADRGSIPAYKVGGVYLRFKRQQIDEFIKTSNIELTPKLDYSVKDKLLDFYYFYDFYIFSFIVILLMVFIILK